MATEQWKKDNAEKMRAYRREWYYKNKETQISRQRQRRKEIREWFDAYKRTLCCEVCGENHPACLSFHHVDESKKKFNLGILRSGDWSIKTILAEIAKCQVLCENCHRKLHYNLKNK